MISAPCNDGSLLPEEGELVLQRVAGHVLLVADLLDLLVGLLYLGPQGLHTDTAIRMICQRID